MAVFFRFANADILASRIYNSGERALLLSHRILSNASFTIFLGQPMFMRTNPFPP